MARPTKAHRRPGIEAGEAFCALLAAEGFQRHSAAPEFRNSTVPIEIAQPLAYLPREFRINGARQGETGLVYQEPEAPISATNYIPLTRKLLRQKPFPSISRIAAFLAWEG
jgi:hypothetical protein